MYSIIDNLRSQKDRIMLLTQMPPDKGIIQELNSNNKVPNFGVSIVFHFIT